MTDALRDELLRVGETAPPAAVPGDLWARGRRARRRDRVVAGGAVLSVLLVLGGVGWVLGGPRDHAAPPTAPGATELAGAVPSTIHGVPERLAVSREEIGTRWSPEVAETQLAIGRGAVAFATGTFALPVVVTAHDGALHPLDLPGWYGASVAGAMLDRQQALALSPDGRKLAWGWVEFRDVGAISGIKVADLKSGTIRTVEIGGVGKRSKAAAPQTIVWSPDSRWIAWRGFAARKWAADRFSSGSLVGGRIAPQAETSTPLPVTRASNESLAIDSNGVTSIASGLKWHVGNRIWPDLPLEGLSLRGAFRPSGRIIAIGSDYPEAGAVATFLDSASGPGDDPILQRPLAKDLDLYPGGAGFEPFGWIDDDLVVGLVRPGESDDPSYGPPHIVVMSAPTVPEQKWTYRVVARFAEDAFPLNSVSVAVDLMTLDQPTRDFPAPEWPWSDERKVAVYGGGVVAVLAVLVFAVAYRRGRRLG